MNPITPERQVREVVAPGAPPRPKRPRSISDSSSDDESCARVFPYISRGVDPIDLQMNMEDEECGLHWVEDESDNLCGGFWSSNRSEGSLDPYRNVTMFRGNYRSPIDDSDSEIEIDGEDEEEDDEEDEKQEEKDPNAMDIAED